MSTTDSRTGFRLPWSSDNRSNSDQAATEATGGSGDPASGDQTTAAETRAIDESTSSGNHAASESATTPGLTGEARSTTEREETTMTELTAASEAGRVGTSSPSGGGTQSPGRRPSKFLADLTKAMQSAAEAARAETLGKLQADAKAAVEEIHGRSSTEAADLRRRADDDVSQIREWSKQEIARIREETEQKVADRKAQLEREIEDHAALIERHIDRIQARVGAFEAEMAAFFERLLAEQDPTRFAEMAESVPEPPPFDAIETWTGYERTTLTSERVDSTPTLLAAAGEASLDGVAPTGTPELEADAVETDAGEPFRTDDETAAASAAEPAAEPAAVDAAEPVEAGLSAAAPEATETRTAADVRSGDPSAGRLATTPVAEPERPGGDPTAPDDPRLAALGMSASFAEAEAEAAEAAGSAAEADEIPAVADEALAARLAGLVSGEEPGQSRPPSNMKVTHVVVVGLVSVASIASFKRHLGRLAGVHWVGVTSGPDGEFVFAVTHNPDLVLRDAVPGLPGFQARVTGTTDDTVEVTARDPESEG